MTVLRAASDSISQSINHSSVPLIRDTEESLLGMLRYLLASHLPQPGRMGHSGDFSPPILGRMCAQRIGVVTWVGNTDPASLSEKTKGGTKKEQGAIKWAQELRDRRHRLMDMTP